MIKLDHHNGTVSRILENNERNGYESTIEYKGAQMIVDLDKLSTESARNLSIAAVFLSAKEADLPAMLHINLFSPVLQIPQRVEIPLRYIIKGGPPIKRHLYGLFTCIEN